MKQWNRKLTFWTLGLAIGAALPVLPASAADEPKIEKIARDKVPAPVMQTFQQRLPAGADVTEYIRQERGNKHIYVVRYKQPGAKGNQKMLASSEGQFLLGPLPGDEAVSDAELNRAIAAAAAIPVTPINPVTPVPPVTPIPSPLPPVASASLTPEQARAEIDRLEAQQNALRVDIQRADVEVQREQQRIADLDGRVRAGDAAAAAQRQQLITEENRLLVDRGQRSAEIDRIEQRQRELAVVAGLPVDEQARLASATDDRDTSDKDVHYTRITEKDVPAEALRGLQRYTKGNHDFWYRRELIDNKLSYSVHYLSPENKRYWVSVLPNGQPRTEPRLSIYQPGKAAPVGAPPSRENRPGAPVPPVAAEQLFDRDRADNAAGAKFAKVSADQVPPAARTALEKLTKGQDDVQYRRDTDGTKVYYTAHYVTPKDGNRHWLTVNENGSTVTGPKLSAYQSKK